MTFFYDFLSMKIYVYVQYYATSKSNKQKTWKTLFFVNVLKVTDENSRIQDRIRTRIH